MGYIQDFGEQMIEKCMAAFGEKFDPGFEPEYGKRLYDYDIWYNPEEGYLHIIIEGSGMLSFTFFPQLVEVDGGYSYSMLRYDGILFNEGWYRHEVYEMAQFLGLDEVIYLPSDRHPMAIYLEYAWDNMGYDALKQKVDRGSRPAHAYTGF
ncbi:MAG: hypothetical protein U5L96_06015 [Owenweeksia sp.]|nr:hypothetical protein [Owenweeksia sp.]